MNPADTRSVVDTLTTSAIARELPVLAATLPLVALGSWPTPVHRLETLSDRLGIDLWVKRDDVSANAYGGNKVRKLEIILGAARQARATSLLTVGGMGSNHIIATAIHGAKALGLPTHAVVVPQPHTTEAHANLDLAWRLGVHFLPCPHRAAVPWTLWRASRAEAGRFLIGPGGSDPLGTIAHVAAAFELRRQIEAGDLPEPDEIVVALGSGGTAAGLALGLGAAGLRSTLVAVRVVERPLCNETLVHLLAARTRGLLTHHGVNIPALNPHRIEVVHTHAGPRYGAPTTAATAARDMAAFHEGLILETTYTGKAFAALISRAAAPKHAQRILFWNTHASRRPAPPHAAPHAASLLRPLRAWLSEPI